MCDTLMYQCSNSRHTYATKWQGSIFACYNLDLVHSRCCSYSVSCGNQAAQYRPLSLENGCHISQVEITFNSRSQLDGKTVGCLDKVDNNGSANVLIGRTVITPTKGE